MIPSGRLPGLRADALRATFRGMRSHPASWLALLLVLRLAPADGAGVDFAHEVVPILRQRCGECHAGDKKKGGFSMNTRVSLLAGGENGAVLVPGQPGKTKLLELIASDDPDVRMPPKGPRLSAREAGVLRAWVEQGADWTEGFAFKQPAYEPSLRPRQPVLPPVVDGRDHPVDRVLDGWLAARKLPRPARADDATFLRRVSLDLIGLLPSPEETQRFLADPAPDKRARLVTALLARDVDYADHWMAFWNDLLRNDYAGTGYIDGGRKQITPWLYAALVNNKPYDQFVRELVAPTAASEGFAKGIVWRGAVSAGQVPELQFAQNVSQAFLGINMKCASCHDSFVDRWKLSDAYGLAAIYADHPMELVRCDVPTGKFAAPAWPFPELGQVDGNRPREERLTRLAELLTQPDNARFQRTLVNRLWHRLMGRGVVHPVDAMQTEPWSEDLLDVLANRFVATGYDLRAMLAFIATSEAYQSRAEVQAPGADDKGYVYRGPRAKRLTAEQFVDQVWRLTGTVPLKIDAAVVRAPAGAVAPGLLAQPVWSDDFTRGRLPAAGEARSFRGVFTVPSRPEKTALAVTCDNSFEVWVNDVQLGRGDNWAAPQLFDISPFVVPGQNRVLVVGRNGGKTPNVAALWCQVVMRVADGREQAFATDASWEWTDALPDAKGALPRGARWRPAAPVPTTSPAWKSAEALMSQLLAGAMGRGAPLPRASLVKSDLLQRALGRPNREQVVSMRPNELSTLEAIDLANGAALATLLDRGAAALLARPRASSADLVRWLYLSALCRPPSSAELEVAVGLLGEQPTERGAADLLWAVLMLPEFQTVR